MYNFMFLLGTRSRIDELEKTLSPNKKSDSHNRTNTWRDILTSKKKEYLQNFWTIHFRKMLHDKGFTVGFILNIIQNLYSTLSDDEAHEIGFTNKIPKSRDDIRLAFSSVGYVPDNNEISFVEFLLTPLSEW